MQFFKTSLSVAAFALAFALPAHADNTGLAVTGTLSFGGFGQYWDTPNTVIGPGTEYVYRDIPNSDTANFTGTQLTITDDVRQGASAWEMTFSTPAGFDSLSLVASNFRPNLSYSLNAGTIVIDWAGTPRDGLEFAVFDVSAVPEPETCALMLVGLVAVGVVARRRKA